MKVKDAIFALQQLDPEIDLLVKDPHGGLHYATTAIEIGKWVDDDDDDVYHSQPVAIVGLRI